MAAIVGAPLVGRTTVAPASLAPIGAMDPSGILDAPDPVRALAAFVLVAVCGGLLLWRFEPFVDRSIDASMSRPLSSLGYGVAAHAAIAFAGVYLATQLAQVDVLGHSVAVLGVAFGLLLVLLAGALGLTVVGSTVVEFAWERRHWHGLVVGACVAAAAVLLDPVAGAVLWFVVVSMGIGGPVRNWLHADAVRDR